MCHVDVGSITELVGGYCILNPLQLRGVEYIETSSSVECDITHILLYGA